MTKLERLERELEQANQARTVLAKALRRIERDEELGSDENARIWMKAVAGAALKRVGVDLTS